MNLARNVFVMKAILSIAALLSSSVALTCLTLARLISEKKRLKPLNGNEVWMTVQEREFVSAMIKQKIGYLFKGWSKPGNNDHKKRSVIVATMEKLKACAADLERQRLQSLQTPTAERCNQELEAHGDIRQDPYYWLRDDSRRSKAVLQHLQNENAYTMATLADTAELQEVLYLEMRARIQEADQSVPIRHGSYYYYTRTLEGEQYKVHCRRKVLSAAAESVEYQSMDTSSVEETILDENFQKEVGRHSFYLVGSVETSPNHELLAWSEDTTGNEHYTIRVKDVATNKEIMGPIHNTSGDIVWSGDNQHIFFVTKDSQERPHKVWRQMIGRESKSVLVFEETDDAFYVGIGKSRSEKIIFIDCGSAITSESRFINANQPLEPFNVIIPRENDVQYEVFHRGDYFYIILRDKQRPNSEILLLSLSSAGANERDLKILLPHSLDVKLEGLILSSQFLALFKRTGGLQQGCVFQLPSNGVAPAVLEGGADIEFQEPAYSLSPGSQGDFDSNILRLEYTSLTTPTSVIDLNMVTKARSIKKVQPVLGGFIKEEFVTERLWAESHDGMKVPVSIVYKKGLVKLEGSDPLLLNGYGSYEISNDPWFSANRLCLLERGFIFAVAHIRGGGEMGRSWYENGKYLNKKNTFLDFIACAEHLIKQKYTTPKRLAIEGRSAGGLLIGAVCNMRPDLFHSAILGVPFVDCLTTMLDDTIPLTVIEWEEWGNPQQKEFYDYMKSYSPMDNVQPGASYPHMLVTGGLHDPRVGYWEPAKLVARLRELTRPKNLLLLKMELGAGHFSVTGRFERLKEVAFEYAFLLKVSSMTEAPFSDSS
ncbi:hypothetical protein CEUSTIGMA_g6918.t1 [Chlamydomonas eustigma]|uniref:Prolyl endopeptidase n=1 Tax=Chlamydomonas eustigma TaxID=1157962 RepID=A0A250X8U3_9CHLO|nr:hypothetical protein CEUSTIGMA_g6918.t1 [Chlamydomonas eustigma]|eukprot:GAX79477.1 hypothetical protein CEUSTIGMA_g6918.t1 [Chlamydomonas eustigma]